ncbi:hypothetical protein [Sphingomicrobium sediminis]|uniref:Uncharacterized protein n=1 Tax=Sphingomicrobium sediminis TaxID=2950949 RepID=A0A9X2J2J3_9SPHN|nr:hypothetical protein [Sphingomicrobium sediminis]MCM8558353.1 hypothetical protein [Sphingomicrobium sediminis]
MGIRTTVMLAATIGGLNLAAPPAAAQDYWVSAKTDDTLGIVDIDSIVRLGGDIVEIEAWYLYSEPRGGQFYGVGGTVQYDCANGKYRLVIANGRGEDGSLNYGPEESNSPWNDLAANAVGASNYDLACGNISIRKFQAENEDVPDDLAGLVVTVRMANSIETAVEGLEIKN